MTSLPERLSSYSRSKEKTLPHRSSSSGWVGPSYHSRTCGRLLRVHLGQRTSLKEVLSSESRSKVKDCHIGAAVEAG